MLVVPCLFVSLTIGAPSGNDPISGRAAPTELPTSSPTIQTCDGMLEDRVKLKTNFYGITESLCGAGLSQWIHEDTKKVHSCYRKISCGDENTGVSPPNITDACFFKQPCVGKKGSGGPVDPLTGFSQAQFTSKDSLGRWTSDCLRRQDCRTDFSEWKCYVEEACNTSTTRAPTNAFGIPGTLYPSIPTTDSPSLSKNPFTGKNLTSAPTPSHASRRVSPSMLTMVAMSIFYSIH